MRVLNLVTNGQARFFVQQVRELEANGVETTTLSVPGQRRLEDGGWSDRRLRHYVQFLGPALAQSFGEYDLVHANYGLTAPYAVVQPNLPVVISLWGTDLLGPFGWLSKGCARFADAVVVMTREMARVLDQECHVIPHGVDLDRFQPTSQADAQATLGWDPEVAHVLFPYGPDRGVKDYPRAERVVGRARSAIETPVELHAQTGAPHELMPTYMNAADVLLLTSTREGSPNSVKEALACNLPVVATDVGDVAERLEGVDLSVAASSDEALVDGLVRALSAGRRSNGRAAAREVSVARTNERLRAVYRSVVAGTEPPDESRIVPV